MGLRKYKIEKHPNYESACLKKARLFYYLRAAGSAETNGGLTAQDR